MQKIVLTASDISRIKELAKHRYDNNRKAKNKIEKVSDTVHETPYHPDIVGLCGEWAVAKYLGVDVDSVKWVYDNAEFTHIKHSIFDVANVEVRSTEYKTGRLIIRDIDVQKKPNTPFVLCVVQFTSNGCEVTLKGWRYAKDCNIEQWRETRYKTAFFVPATCLHSLTTLPKE